MNCCVVTLYKLGVVDVWRCGVVDVWSCEVVGLWSCGVVNSCSCDAEWCIRGVVGMLSVGVVYLRMC